MRRKDREITNPDAIDQILTGCDCCRLGIATEGAPYVVPLNFGYRREGGVPTFYFHCAKEGRKLELLRRQPRVGFELDTRHQLKEGATACRYSFGYQSVIGVGTVAFVTDEREKREALECILRQYTGRTGWQWEEAALGSVTVLRLHAEELTCKAHA